ncbi:hypothetical protein RR46_12360 [Papilio xuthus]|uniref:Uncharacterized protein n=1 Tax=Papilio xuthus TaxID=66420 RepID=A0A194PYU7_PAPXU|nr:hypothetical protein RR46_12360 [Papilio xuthus]
MSVEMVVTCVGACAAMQTRRLRHHGNCGRFVTAPFLHKDEKTLKKTEQQVPRRIAPQYIDRNSSSEQKVDRRRRSLSGAR